MTKHAAIYPSEDELQSIQKIVSITERALKLVSDIITDQDKIKEEDKEKADALKDRCGVCAARTSLTSDVLQLLGLKPLTEAYCTGPSSW